MALTAPQPTLLGAVYTHGTETILYEHAGIDDVLICNLGRAVTSHVVLLLTTVSFLQMQPPCSVVAHVCNPLGAGIDLGLEAELSVVVLSSGFSTRVLLLLVQGGQPLHLVQEALPGMRLLRGSQHVGCCACLWAEGALLVLLHKHEQVCQVQLAVLAGCLLHGAAQGERVCTPECSHCVAGNAMQSAVPVMWVEGALLVPLQMQDFGPYVRLMVPLGLPTCRSM